MSDTQQNETNYEPTDGENKLLEVILNPENRHKKIIEICSMAGVDRSTYYRAFKKPEFVSLIKNTAKEMAIQAVVPIINTFIREANRGSFQHGKVILEMAEAYTEKTKQEISGPGGGPLQTQSVDMDWDKLAQDDPELFAQVVELKEKLKGKMEK